MDKYEHATTLKELFTNIYKYITAVTTNLVIYV